MIQALLWIGVIALLLIAIMELVCPNSINEGFEQFVSIGDSSFWSQFVPRRGDVGQYEEEKGYVRDDRYFNGYTDVQRLGQNQDFCRMVFKEADPKDTFFACALGGTEGLSSIQYKTPSTRDGFEICRDDYMQKLEDNRDAYCRILKINDTTFEVRCNEASDRAFRKNTTLDYNPPSDIQLLLLFYDGVIFWLRLRDDMVDYAKNIFIYKAGNMRIEEFPPLPRDVGTRTLHFNGIDQFLRLGDNKQFEFGNRIELRYMRAITFWVYFEEFTNNAHIIDFGNGAGRDNVWCGILGRGNAPLQADPIRSLICGKSESTLPTPPSGQQHVPTTSPQNLMLTSSANVDEFTCPKPEIYGKIMPPIQPKAEPPHEAKNADLIYEIWDHQQRKFRIQVKDAIPLRKWVHVVITAHNADAFRPDIDIYRNGELVHTEPEGWLPQENYTTHNYIGKSNWTNVTSQYENADELFKGRMFDIRGYRTPISEKKAKAMYNWGKKYLEGEEVEEP